VLNSGKYGGSDGLAPGNQVDAAKLGRLGRAGMRHTDQLHKCRGWPDPVPIGNSIEGIAGHGFAGCGQFPNGFRAH
jgi:hypothetical protein